MNEWAQLLLGSGATGVPVLGLVLWGKLIPVWVVRRQTDELTASHQRELKSKDDAHADALAVRDREVERLNQALEYERGAKDVERNRSDAATGRLADLAGEFGSNHRKLLDAVEAAARDRG